MSEQNELGSPQEIAREAIDLRTKYEALKLERDDLKLVVETSVDEAAASTTGSAAWWKREAAKITLKYLENTAALKAQVERLSAPVTDEEVAEYGLMIQPVGEDTCGLYFGLESIGDMLASRTAPAKETE